MRGYKLCVYAICRDEEQFAERWIRSMSEADGIYVLDTGSSDGTAELLRSLGAVVRQEIIRPWRFDTARNRSLELVPQDADLCICTDLDEVFRPGWRIGFERALDSGARLVRYRYTWSFRPDGSEGVVFWSEKAHSRHGFHWVNPVHEVLQSEFGTIPAVSAEGVQLDHHPDPGKSRSQYLPLLELAVRERPDDDRNVHYLGREYMYRRMWPECEAMLLRHLQMPSAVWRDERSASMRYLARAALAQGCPSDAESWLLRAAAEAPWLREPWLDASAFAASRSDWFGSLYFARRALEIRERSQSYINEAESWGARPYDLATVAAYYAGCFELARQYGTLACRMEPQNPRLQTNLQFYEARISS